MGNQTQFVRPKPVSLERPVDPETPHFARGACFTCQNGVNVYRLPDSSLDDTYHNGRTSGDSNPFFQFSHMVGLKSPSSVRCVTVTRAVDLGFVEIGSDGIPPALVAVTFSKSQSPYYHIYVVNENPVVGEGDVDGDDGYDGRESRRRLPVLIAEGVAPSQAYGMGYGITSSGGSLGLHPLMFVACDSASSDETSCVAVSVDTGETRCRFGGVSNDVRGIRFVSEWNNRVFFAGSSPQLTEHDATTGKFIRELTGNASYAEDVDVGLDRGVVYCVDIMKNLVMHDYRCESSSSSSMKLSRNGYQLSCMEEKNLLVIGESPSLIEVYDVRFFANTSPVASFNPHSDSPSYIWSMVRMGELSDQFISASSSGSGAAWKIDGTVLGSAKQPHTAYGCSYFEDEDQSYASSGSSEDDDGRVALLENLNDLVAWQVRLSFAAVCRSEVTIAVSFLFEFLGV